MADNALDTLLEQAETEKDILKTAMAKGLYKSYEEYKYGCGQIRGIDAMVMKIQRIRESIYTGDDDES